MKALFSQRCGPGRDKGVQYFTEILVILVKHFPEDSRADIYVGGIKFTVQNSTLKIHFFLKKAFKHYLECNRKDSQLSYWLTCLYLLI